MKALIKPLKQLEIDPSFTKGNLVDILKRLDGLQDNMELTYFIMVVFL